MKKLFVIIVMCCFMFICASCKNDNIKFEVIEENPSLISLVDKSSANEVLFDGDGSKIYKDYDEMFNDFNSSGVIIEDQSFYEKYCADFFDKKSLALLYSCDPMTGYKYTFESISVIDNELFLNINIDNDGMGLMVVTQRLFIIEINKKDIKEFDKLKYKVKVNE